jgi:iron complex outermembrane receptor protein
MRIARTTALALSAFCAPATAQGELEEIVVTADPLSAYDAHLARPAKVLDEHTLRDKDIRSIGEAVADTPGVSAADFGPAVGRPVIRGLTGARVRVLEDGIGTMDVSTISQDHAVAAEPVFAEQIEIFRGPATLLYGSGASGGFVNIVDKRIPSMMPDRLHGEAYGHYDSVADGWLGAFNATGPLGDYVAVHLELMQRDTDDYDIPGFSETVPDEDATAGVLDNSDVDTEQVTGGASFVGERGFIGLSVGAFANNYGVPGAHREEEGAGAEEEAEAGVRIDQEQTRFDLKGELHDPLAGLRLIRTRWGYNDHTHIELEGGGEIGARLDNKEWEGRIEAVHDRLGPWDGVIGVQLQNRDFTSRGVEAFVPPSEQVSHAIFIFEKADIGHFHIDAGIRYERTESSAPDRHAGFDAFSISGAAGYEYAEGYEIGLSLTRAERAPAIEELFSAGPHLATNSFEIGGPDLNRELSINVDAYWRKTGGRFTFAANVFFNAVDDFIFLLENDRNGDGAADRVEPDFLDTGEIVTDDDELLLVNHTQDNAWFYGFEAELGATLLNDERGTLSGRVWTDYVRGKLDGNRNLPRITPMRAGFDLDYAWRNIDAGLNLTHAFEQDDLAALETGTDGYTMLNAHVGCTVALGHGAEARLFLRGVNLLNAEARRHTSFLKDRAPLPGRSMMAGARITF